MIVGHFGMAYGVRALDKRDPDACVSLLWLLAAAIAPDILDGVFALGKYCNPDGMMSHSLPAVAILAVVFGVAAFLHTRRATTALLVAGMVVLHLPPDFLTGRKLLWPGGPVVGLYIYRWPWLDLLVEVPVIVGGWWMLRRTPFTPRLAVSGLALAAMLTVQCALDLQSQLRGPQPARVCTR
ncbi:MAG: metal-dependent hydrolase [Gemmatimonadaceae bacterium]